MKNFHESERRSYLDPTVQPDFGLQHHFLQDTKSTTFGLMEGRDRLNHRGSRRKIKTLLFIIPLLTCISYHQTVGHRIKKPWQGKQRLVNPNLSKHLFEDLKRFNPWLKLIRIQIQYIGNSDCYIAGIYKNVRFKKDVSFDLCLFVTLCTASTLFFLACITYLLTPMLPRTSQRLLSLNASLPHCWIRQSQLNS